ncbi:hypothetical protein TWF694_003287 [Orbilia ellipsospora]|uniref:Uncharacterized protein n=1 Tax=Orbilia ellipsospora TaxID=2528407 RepID=A0AAV9X2C6_9PEZI
MDATIALAGARMACGHGMDMNTATNQTPTAPATPPTSHQRSHRRPQPETNLEKDHDIQMSGVKEDTVDVFKYQEEGKWDIDKNVPTTSHGYRLPEGTRGANSNLNTKVVIQRNESSTNISLSTEPEYNQPAPLGSGREFEELNQRNRLHRGHERERDPEFTRNKGTSGSQVGLWGEKNRGSSTGIGTLPVSHNPEFDAVIINAHGYKYTQPARTQDQSPAASSLHALNKTKNTLFTGVSKGLASHTPKDTKRIVKPPAPTPRLSSRNGRFPEPGYEQERREAEIERERGYARDINRLNQEVDNQRKHHQTQLEGLQRQLDREDAFLTHQRTDSELNGLVSSMREEVQTFGMKVAKIFKTPSPGTIYSKISVEFEQDIKTVVPSSDKSLFEIFASMKPKQRRFFVQGWVHLVLCKYVFTSNFPIKDRKTGVNPSELWLPSNTANAVKELENEVALICTSTTNSLGPAAFHKWRTLTMSILRAANPTGGSTRENRSQLIESKCQKMAEVLQELRETSVDFKPPEDLNVLRKEREENVRLLQVDLVDIFENAVKLASLLRTQRAAFEMRYPMVALPNTHDLSPRIDNLHLNQTWMDLAGDPKGHGPQSIVDYVVEPALFKSGNANGEKYDVEAGCFLKATVACLHVPPDIPKNLHK